MERPKIRIATITYSSQTLPKSPLSFMNFSSSTMFPLQSHHHLSFIHSTNPSFSKPMVANIWVAAADNQVDVIKSYLDSGKFTPNSKDPNGYTPIHAAASYGHIELLKLLIQNGGNINIQDNEGDTPLHHVEELATATIMVEELGADYKLKNAEGQTAGEYIEEDGDFPELAQYLRSLMHDQPQSVLAELPSPGNVEGHHIRYSMEEDNEDMSEERRKQLEEIANSENPEEALRKLVTSAVREGLANYKTESDEPEAKRSR